MSTALAVTSHDHMLAPPDRHTPGAHVFTPPQEQSLEAALAETHALLEQHGYLVAVYPATLPTPYLHRLHTIRALLESQRIALMPVALPPLATGVLVRQLRQLSLCDFTPGVLGAAARLLTHYLYAGAVLNSVAKLDRVPVSLGSHAKSWMPGAQFAVLAAPTPELVRLGGEGAPGLTGPQFATHLTVATGQLATDWVTGTLGPRWQVGEVHEAYLPEDSPAWWGTGKLVEFVAAIPDVSVLYQLVSSVRRDECHWCGLELIGDRCAFCAAPAPPVTPAPAPPASSAGAASTALSHTAPSYAPTAQQFDGSHGQEPAPDRDTGAGHDRDRDRDRDTDLGPDRDPDTDAGPGSGSSSGSGPGLDPDAGTGAHAAHGSGSPNGSGAATGAASASAPETSPASRTGEAPVVADPRGIRR
ncbi:hypothetical protein [Streptomyces iconiensis]|uniref:hypothetical protein n=1 Tax=Streptomyces iconiensis TaxID=1384038 RepID=UPI0032190D3F